MGKYNPPSHSDPLAVQGDEHLPEGKPIIIPLIVQDSPKSRLRGSQHSVLWAVESPGERRSQRLWAQNRGFEGEMSLCFIQLAHKVPLLGSFLTARDSDLGSPHPHPKAQGKDLKLPGQKGRFVTLAKVKGGVLTCE